MKRVLSGIQASGEPHIGNYFGSFVPNLKLQNDPTVESFFMIADLHAFTSKPNPDVFKKNQENLVLDLLAVGFDPDKCVFFRQSDVPAHTELAWYLSCSASMGLLERAVAFKDKKEKGLGANVGLFTYPILQAADILLYSAEIVPVGKDQKQHIEIARDIAQKFNHEFGETFTLPEAQIDETLQVIPGLDGAKMSKSYGNTIPIFADEKVMKKQIMSIKTASANLGDPLDPDTCQVFAYHALFQNPELESLRDKYKTGKIGFGESKKQLLTLIWEYFRAAREKRAYYEQNPDLVSEILKKGAIKANEIAAAKLAETRSKLGLAPKHILVS